MLACGEVTSGLLLRAKAIFFKGPSLFKRLSNALTAVVYMLTAACCLKLRLLAANNEYSWDAAIGNGW